MKDQMLTVAEAAEEFGYPVKTVYRYIQDGVIPAYRPSPRKTFVLRDEVRAALLVPYVPQTPMRVIPRLAAPVRPAVDVAPAPVKRTRRSRKPETSLLEATRYAHPAMRPAS